MAIPYDRKTPHRFDIVGSFLRPAALKQARADLEAGAIDRAALTKVEDREIRALIGREKQAGLGVITDGELRRGSWHLDFMWPFEGVGHHRTTTGLPFHGEAAMVDDTFLTGPVAAPAHHPFVDHFKFVQAQEDERTVAKQTIPAPAQFYAQFAMPFSWQLSHRFYDAPERLIDDIVVAYEQVIGELYAAGCRNLQLDDCTWPMTVDENARQFWGDNLDAVRRNLLEANNRVLEALPADLTVTTHICRGNFHSTYACSGPYDDVAPIVFAHENVTAFFLEFDDERSGGFAPLASVPDDKVVVLGLITSKRPQLEDKDAVIARIHEASAYHPLERLALSPQCGFSSTEEGNKLTDEDQWRKLALVREIAEEVWG